MLTWGSLWGLQFNLEKCNVVSFSSKNNVVKFKYWLNGVPLEHVKNTVDLGVVPSTFVWNDHIANCVKRVTVG